MAQIGAVRLPTILVLTIDDSVSAQRATKWRALELCADQVEFPMFCVRCGETKEGLFQRARQAVEKVLTACSQGMTHSNEDVCVKFDAMVTRSQEAPEDVEGPSTLLLSTDSSQFLSTCSSLPLVFGCWNVAC